MQKLQNDEPITNPEKDTLGYSSYARVVAERILEAPTPLTVGIFGPWGSGKTSLMRLIEDRCRPPLQALGKPAKPKVETLWINVWQLASREEVWDAFLQALISAVRGKLPFWKQLNWKALGRQLAVNGYRIALALIPVIAGALVAGVKTSGSGAPSSIEVVRHFFSQPHNWVLGSATGILELLLLFWAFREPLKSAVSFDLKTILRTGSFQERITELSRLDRQFRSLVEELVGKDQEGLPEGRLIVFIDDLDRCATKVIPDVLEAIRLFASQKHCVYVLGLDQKLVWNAIRDVYKFTTEEEAGRYFEKIVQIPFQLPPLGRPAIKGFLFELVPPEVSEVFAQGIEGTPRALKRSYQIYSIWEGLHAYFLHQWQVDPLEPELMAKWLTIQMRFRQLSEFVAHKTEHLLWLEREALRKASESRPLGPLDARLVEDAAADPQDSKATKLSEYDDKELSALLIAGECRFNQRVYRETLDSYIYLGGGSSGSDGQVRAQSRERQMLFSGGVNERQQIINQLLHWSSPKRFQYRDAGNLYQERLRAAFNAPDVLESWEKDQVEALFRCFERFHDNTVCVPPRHHILGAPAEWTDESRKDDKDNFTEELANRECQRPLINIPGFRIRRFPVTNDEFQYFLDEVRSNGPHDPVPFSIVEYEAYCEPLAEKRWQYAPERESVNRRPGSFGTPQGSPEPKRHDTPEKRSGSVEIHQNGDFGPLLASVHIEVKQEAVVVNLSRPEGGGAEVPAPISLMYRKSAVLKRPGLIVLVTLGGSPTIQEFGQPILPGLPFTVVVRAWQADRFIQLDRPDNREWQFRSRQEQHPAANVSWDDAVAYCVWQRCQTGKPYRLPREPEWEAAATGDGQKKTRYPWGDKWNARYANSREGGLGCTSPVGSYSPEGDSPFAVSDMAGNVAEWCADPVRELRDTTESGLLWEEVRKPFRGGSEPSYDNITRIARGGSFQDSKAFARTTCRNSYPPDHKSASVGFRMALATELEGLL